MQQKNPISLGERLHFGSPDVVTHVLDQSISSSDSATVFLPFMQSLLKNSVQKQLGKRVFWHLISTFWEKWNIAYYSYASSPG